MKRNILLGGVFLSLLTAVYWFEEVGGQKRKEREEQDTKTFPFLGNESSLGNTENLGEMKEVRLGKIRLVKKGQDFYTTEKNQKVDLATLNSVFEKLASIVLERKISPEEQKTLDRRFFFKNEEEVFHFIFQKGEIKYLLGEKLQVGETFYMEITHQGKVTWVVAKDEGPRLGIYMDNEENSPEKYVRLKSLLYLQEDFFIGKHQNKST